MVSADFDPSLFHPYYFIRKSLLRKIQYYAPTLQGDLLDFGCGAKPYRSLFTGVSTYTGVDIENEGHTHVNEQIDVYYDGKRLPFEGDKFDAIFASEVFEHVFNMEEILVELNRVLKTGGKMLITCPFVWPEHEKPYDYARYTVFSLQDMLNKAGFNAIVIDKSGDFFSAVYQLRVSYINDILLPKLTFPFLVNVVRKLLMPVLNVWGIVVHRILPVNKSLYLNNVLIAQKK